jgi:HD-GYP domain-containing protein (c-di-GMP phosphodiesterase class II)
MSSHSREGIYETGDLVPNGELGLSAGSGTRKDSSIEGFLLFDENLNCVSVNSAVERMFHVTEEEVLGKNILEVVPNVGDEGAYEKYRSVMSGEEATIGQSALGDLRLGIKAFKVGRGLGVILSDTSERSQERSDECSADRRLDLAGRLAALGELVGSVGRELDVLAGEQAALEEIKAGYDTGDIGPKASVHTRELTSYLKEFNRAMSQFVGAREIADLEEAYLQMARTLALMAEMREPYARGHSERVSLLCNDIAVWLGCTPSQIREIQIAAILHDIGKIAVPDHILFKPGQLTVAEYNEVKRHPIASVEILGNLNCFDSILPIIEGHHEWYNGMGYPNRLKADAIQLEARILSVADAYDAMTSPRPHRSRLANREAIEIIRNGAGTQWDPMVVYTFLEVVGQDGAIGANDGDDNGDGQLRLSHRVVAETERQGGGQAVKEKEGVVTRAEEALERAKHWAHWMESVQKPQNEGRKGD